MSEASYVLSHVQRRLSRRLNHLSDLTIIVSIVGSLGFMYVALAKASGSMMAIFLTAAFTCYVLYIAGCCNVARGKGYTPALGLIGLFGIIVLAVMPQKKIEV